MNVLLDLSVLSTPNLSRGMGRYVASLAQGLHERARSAGDLRVLGMWERPLWGAPRVTEDLPAAIEELSERRRLGRSSMSGGTRALGRAAAESRADVLHSLDPEAAPTTSLAVPRLLTCHHVNSRGQGSWHGQRAYVMKADRKRYQSVDRIIAISRATTHELITRVDVPREKISTVHHGISLEKWVPVSESEVVARRMALGLGDRPYLLGVGAVEDRKNIVALLQGLARARALLGREDLIVVWAGRLDRGEKAKLRAVARRAGVSGAVVMVGYVSDRNLAALYSGATALVFVSHREGFGYPVVEAMACGCPVVTSNCTSLFEVAEGAAMTVSPDDTEAIADAIVLLADDNAERRRLGRAGRKRASEFSLEKMVQGTIEAYEIVKREDSR